MTLFLSPLIFNLVVDGLIRRVAETPVGAEMGCGVRVGSSAFADDIILFATTEVGLQKSMDLAVGYLSGCNLHINNAKSFSLAVCASAKRKQTWVGTSAVTICGQRLRALLPKEEFTYLGTRFTADGLMWANPLERLETMLTSTRRAPLKPQQRLHILRNYILPRLYHSSVLARVHVGVLRKCDVAVRKFVRRTLDLPHDVPNAYIHGDVAGGGLGIDSLRLQVPHVALKRFENVRRRLSPAAEAGAPGTIIGERITRLQSICLSNDPKAFNRRALYDSVDGAGLSMSSDTPGQHGWIASPSLWMRGSDYIQCAKFRVGALPCRVRCGRGRPGRDFSCRAGCNAPETLNHIQQNCSRTHGKRVARHEALAKYVRRALGVRGFETHPEPVYETEAGRRKPDLVAVKGDTCYVIDFQVVSDKADLNRAHLDKLNKYRPIQLAVGEKFSKSNVETLSVTLNWRGVWSPKSAGLMIEFGLLTKHDIQVLSTRALVGGLASFRYFMRSTTMEHRGRRVVSRQPGH